MGVSSGARANPLTGAGRHRLAQVALAHPVRTVILVHLVSRIVAWLVLEVAARGFQNPAGVDTLDPTAVDLLPLWDSKWYERIARHGYPVPLPLDPQTGRFTYSAWAFYPLFPLLMRGLDAIGVPFIAGALVLNVVLSTLAAVLIWATLHQGTHADPQPQRARLALVAACLWSFYPATPVMLKPYTEALAMVLIAASLWALLRRRYLLVALLSVPLGFTRGVAPALGLAALVHLVVRWREDRRAGLDPLRGARVAAVVMLVMAGLSGVAWPLVAGWVSGIPSAFFEVQAAWGMQPSAGPFTLWLQWARDSKGVLGVIVIVGLVATYISLIAGRHGRWIPVEVRAWAIAYPIYLFAVVRPITSMWRFLLLDFPLAALAASVAMRTSNGSQVVPHWRRRVGIVVLLLLIGMLWWSSSLLTYTPWGSRPP
ncbi:MAG TPA: hypothetical protein PLP55_00120 [Phycicoccus elongatus]|uniref:hypothetical protein n=1 Tax=Phycicoccus elongatus TaxID=101689 RepID=UPI002C690BB6|nr:hypothetical protein [Phycicoccus elongatus]HPK11071.1 hypothetical protein [Phycicoccus elongatus]